MTGVTDPTRSSDLDEGELERTTKAITEGLKPVAKIEVQGDDAFEARAADVATRFPELTWRWRRPARTVDAGLELFVGLCLETVEEAIDLTERSEEERDPRAVEELITQLGVIFGYPVCCSEAFAREQPFFRDQNEWLHVKRRIGATEKVSPDAHPMITGYIPCSLDCDETLHLVAAHSRLDNKAHLRRWPASPTVLLLDRPGHFAALKPAGKVSSSGRDFEFEVEVCRGDDPRIDLLTRGRSLSVEPGRITVLRDDSIVAELDDDAFIWWSGGVFHRSHWEALLRKHSESTTHKPPRAGSNERFRQILDRLAEHSSLPLRGFKLLGLVEKGALEIALHVGRGEEHLRFDVLPESRCSRAFASVNGFGVVPHPSTPIVGEDRQAVVHIILKALSKELAKRR